MWPDGAMPGECQQQPNCLHAASVELGHGLPSGEQSFCSVACEHVAVPLGQPPGTSHATLASRAISEAPTATKSSPSAAIVAWSNDQNSVAPPVEPGCQLSPPSAAAGQGIQMD